MGQTPSVAPDTPTRAGSPTSSGLSGELPYLLIDRDHRVAAVSEGMAHLFELEVDDVVDLDPESFLDASEGVALNAAYRRVHATPGASERVAVRLVDRSGIRRAFDLRIVNRLDDPAVEAIVMTATDITRASAHRVVEHLRSRLLDLLPTVVTVVDDLGTIVYCSPRSEEVLGRRASELIGRSITQADLFVIEPDQVEAIRVGAEERGHWVGDVELRRDDGSTLPVQLVIERVDDHEIGFHGTVGISFDITQRRELEAHLEFQAAHDALTGLYNRQRFVELLERALVAVERSGTRIAVVFIDLDDFKAVNDRIGHAAGDALLTAVGAQLQSVLGPDGVAARFGGDEFVVFRPDVVDADAGVELARGLLDALRQPIGSGPDTAVIGASAGVALSSPGVLAEELLRRSDHAMYGAKDGGKNRIEVFDDDVSHRKRRRREMADELERALDRGELAVHFQPEVALHDGRISFLEALVRWDDGQRGSIAPSEFVTIAEASGLIHRLGRVVLEASCRALRIWLDLGLADDLSVAVNVSTRQLLDHDFPDTVGELLSEWSVPPGQVCLEVTESALVDADVASRALQRLDAIGVTIAIDDFGTGYSSLGRLTQFPLDFLKIDRTFVAGLATDPASASIVRMIANLAHELGVQATAEGIESDEQLQLLIDLGCDIGQGFLWSPAVSLEDATAMLTCQPFTGTVPRPRRRLIGRRTSGLAAWHRGGRQSVVRVDRP
ncbi:MAG: hypothetical protein CL424_13495 [Acidimicrobiaceae bacterium]|nr:hypothetical protein [Acidimicrobiaceae bacterium]